MNIKEKILERPFLVVSVIVFGGFLLRVSLTRTPKKLQEIICHEIGITHKKDKVYVEYECLPKFEASK